MILTFGSAGEELARSVSKTMGTPLLIPSMRTFPDGEHYLRVEGDVRGKDVVIFQSLAFKPDQLLFEYCLITNAMKEGGANSVIGVLPYLAYARQDHVFKPNEPLSTKLVAQLIESAGTDQVVTVDMHLHRFTKPEEVFNVPIKNLTAMPLLAEYYRNLPQASAVTVVGPDSESRQWVQVVSRELDAPFIVLDKERLGDREVKIKGEFLLKGRAALIVDDMVSTGETMVEVITRLKNEEVSRVDALVSHALLVEKAELRMKKAGLNQLFYSDTIPGRKPSVSIAPLISASLKGILK